MKGFLERISSLIDIPVSDPDDARRRKILNIMLFVTIIGASFILVITPIVNLYGGFVNEVEFLSLLIGSISGLFSSLIIYIINRRYSGELASTLFVLLLIILAVISDEPYQVAHGRSTLVFVLPILSASVLLRPWSGFVLSVISSIIIAVVSYAIGEPVPSLPVMIILIVIGLITWLSSRSLNQLYSRVRKDEETLTQLNSTLQDRLEELEIYTSLLRHDIRNDLQVIIGDIESVRILMPDDSSESGIMLESALSAAERMERLTKAFRNLEKRNHEPVCTLLERVAKQAESANRGLSIKIHSDNDFENIKTRGGRLLPMVFENIFRNAAEYAGDTPLVDVFLSLQKDQVIIDIIDDGPGISSKIRRGLFEKGVSTKGSGLGLYLAKRIIETSGGSITHMDSQEGKGAFFRIALPLEYN